MIEVIYPFVGASPRQHKGLRFLQYGLAIPNLRPAGSPLVYSTGQGPARRDDRAPQER